MLPDVQRLITDFRLQPHPEGGWYRETYRSLEQVTTSRGTTRCAATSIYFLLAYGAFSAFHKLASDETWHFYRGDPVTLELIEPSGTHRRCVLGEGNDLHYTIPAGVYFAAHVDAVDGFALLGCDVAPGFEFADFHLSTRSMLAAAYPQFGPLIALYTR